MFTGSYSCTELHDAYDTSAALCTTRERRKRFIGCQLYANARRHRTIKGQRKGKRTRRPPQSATTYLREIRNTHDVPSKRLDATVGS